MAKSHFVEYVVEDLLNGMDGVSARAMFGGHGIYREGVIFGIVVEDTLYFKVDETNRKDYEAAQSRPFTYQAKGRKKVSISYWEVPAEILDDREALAEWAEHSRQINCKSAIKRKRSA